VITYAGLRARLQAWPKHPACRRDRRAPLVTTAFPGTFNLSSTEHHWLREYGGFLGWAHDYVFTTIQSCIRVGDLARIGTMEGDRYLGAFEMADLCGEIAVARRPDYHALQGWQIGELVRLLAGLGIPPDRIHASYSSGGRVADLTGGRYRFDDVVPPDDLSRDAFIAAGVPETNLSPNGTRATFLALHVHRATPWGYRNEIHVDVGTARQPRLVDVATAEYFLWRPRFSGAESRREDIVGLDPLDAGATGIGCGLERLAMVANGLRRIHDVDYLQPFYDSLAAVLGRVLLPRDYVVGESLRAVHRIETDLRFHPEADARIGRDGSPALSARRRKKLARLKRCVPWRIQPADLERLLLVHAGSQPWHDGLEATIEPTVRGLEDYRRSQGGSLVPDS
jgi:hypothetical protein